MKFKYCLLLATSIALMGSYPALRTSAQSLTQYRATALNGASSSPDSGAIAATLTPICQSKKSAVVTVYAGSETGSGSIISADGVVLTSNHVVKEARPSGLPVQVRTATGEQFPGHVISADRTSDLALIRLDANQTFPTVRLATADTIHTGEAVCAIGSPYGRPGVLSQGRLSTVRTNGDLQSKIFLYPGNSGGPLLNAQGDMIGVNRAILEASGGRNTGISLATSVLAVRGFVQRAHIGDLSDPIALQPTPNPRSVADPVANAGATVEWSAPPATAAPSMPQAAASIARSVSSLARLSSTPGAQLGVTIDSRNLTVQQVQAGTAAAMGGLRAGDRVIAVNGKPLTGLDALQAFLNQRPTTAILTIGRGQQQTDLQVNF